MATWSFVRPHTDEDAARFLQQAQFSSTRDEIAELRADRYTAWLQRQYQMPLGPTGWDWLESQGYGVVDAQRHFFSTRQADHMLWCQLFSGGPSAMRLRMALALSEFFVASLNTAEFVWRSHAYADWWDMLVRNAFGNFRQLLEDVTLHPAMGHFLNTKGNRKEDARTGRVPDENYAREVMQLFSIGLVNLHLDGTSQGTESYTQDDVSQLARVFTGYDFDHSDGGNEARPGGGTIRTKDFASKPMLLYPERHSSLEARFLGVTVPANTLGAPALRIALDRLFNHPNVGPFFARQMIQRLVTSDPSPAYVARVAACFNDNGAGTRGDLSAVWSAILLDDEARSPAGLSSPTHGKLREPMLRFIQWGRSFGVRSATGTWKIGDLSRASTQLGQSPLRSPSVFNFFRPGYVPPSTGLAAAGATAPEFQIVNETSVSGYLNFMQNAIDRGVADASADYSRELALVHDAQALVSHVCLVLAAGAISATTQAILVQALNSTPLPSTGTAAQVEQAQRRRVCAAIFMVMACPEYLVQK